MPKTMCKRRKIPLTKPLMPRLMTLRMPSMTKRLKTPKMNKVLKMLNRMSTMRKIMLTMPKRMLTTPKKMLIKLIVLRMQRKKTLTMRKMWPMVLPVKPRTTNYTMRKMI